MDLMVIPLLYFCPNNTSRTATNKEYSHGAITTDDKIGAKLSLFNK